MKTKRNLMAIVAIVFAVIAISSCKKVAGPAGAAGADGTNGTDGLNGIDANAFCKTCHTTANWAAAQSQLDSSRHVSGNSMTPGTGRGMRRDCAACHSREGYEETLLTGLDTTANNHFNGTYWMTNYYSNSPVKCTTCHTFHGTLDEAAFPNYALRNVGPFKLRFDHNTYMDLGASNTCARCHQVRTQTDTNYVKPVIPYSGLQETNMVDIRSGSFGVHDGPQSNVFGAKGYYQLSATPYTNATHSTNGVQCGDCHVLSTVNLAGTMGGHTFRMTDGITDNVVQCNKCHTGVTDFDKNGIQTEIKGLLLDIENLLTTKGYYHDGGTPNSLAVAYGGNTDFKLYTTTSGTQTVNASNPLNRSERFAAALFNFKLIVVDASYGVHNYFFIKELLLDVKAEFTAAPNNN